MSYAIQSCCSIRLRNQLLKMVSATNAVAVRRTARIDGALGWSTRLTKMGEL